MKKSDVFFIVANVYLAVVLGSTWGAWWVGIFWYACMLFYMWRESKDGR